MKLDRKGFMLAEVVVVSVVIATVLVTLFVGLNKVSSAYDNRNKYYDVDSLYIAMEINEILKRKATIDVLRNNGNIALLYGNGYGVDNFMDFYADENNIGYYISSTYFVPYQSEKLSGLKEEDINQSFKDYIDYLNGNLDFGRDYDYIIIVERENINDKDDCYYYALKLKY